MNNIIATHYCGWDGCPRTTAEDSEGFAPYYCPDHDDIATHHGPWCDEDAAATCTACMPAGDTTVKAAAYQARRCTVCDDWIFTDAAPFGEGDRTKTQRDWEHYSYHHLTDEERNANCVGFPAMPYNTQPVLAVYEDLEAR